MDSIDNVFEEYKGYVFSFEFDPKSNIKLMKCYFKPDWEVKEDVIIVRKKDNLTLLITKDPNISFTDMLEFISKVIKVNIEREEKTKLLAEKKRQLEEIFNNSSLDELAKLNFKIGENDSDVNTFIKEEVSEISEIKKVD